MGEVYRARDTRPQVGREVAIKLATGLAGDAVQAARFEREALITASLAHPNVVVLHDVGVHECTPYLVEELLVGETLRARLRSGPVPARKAVEWMRQVTLGLAAAHARELVHRDVKPQNIVLVADGHVKLLDFGLAKPTAGPAAAATTTAEPPRDTGHAVTSGAVVLGTVGYMSPEQVRAQTLDHRSDIFSVGVVLYELLTGRRPFDRATAADTMSAVLTAEPPVLEPVADGPLPPALERVVRRCLEKAPGDRFQSTRDLAFALETSGNNGGIASGTHRPDPTPVRPSWTRHVAIAAAAVVGLGLAFGAGRATTPTLAPRVATRLQLTADGQLSTQGGRPVAVSHDGRTLALAITGRDGIRRIHTRRLGEDGVQSVAETEGGSLPFFSPDDRSLGFIVGNEVRQVDLGSGRPSLVWRSVVSNTLNIGSVDWYGRDAFIISPGPRERFEVRGGSAAVARGALRNGELGHLLPQVLPGGKEVLYVSYPLSDTPADANVMAQAIDGGEPRVVVPGSMFGRLFDRYLVYESSKSILAARADADTLRRSGPAVAVAAIDAPTTGHAVAFGGSTMVYLDADFPPPRQFQWVEGARVSDLPTPPLEVVEYALSPDGTTIAAVVGVLGHYVVLVDVASGAASRLTTDIHAHSPLFTPDGRAVVFNSGGALQIAETMAGSTPRLLAKGSGSRIPYAWLPDGKTLVFTEVSEDSGADIWALDPTSTSSPVLLVRTPGHDRYPAVSPDGAWLAFTSEERGRAEVFVQPLNRPGPRRRISREGGTSPLWTPRGRRLHWRSGDQILSVDLDGDGTVGPPVVRATGTFVENRPYPSYAIGRNGRLLVARIPPRRPVNVVNVILNADVEIERLMTEAEAKR